MNNEASTTTTLHRRLGLLDVFCIAAGAMISSGLFILPGLAFGLTGPSICVAYLIAGVLTIPALLSKAELATAMPRAGGVYFYIDRSMGAAMGTLGGIAGWFSLSFKSAFALVGVGAFTAILLPGLGDFELRLVSAAFCVVFVGVNLLGSKHAGSMQIVMVLGLLVVLTVYVFAGVGSLDGDNFTPFATGGYAGLLATVGFVFVSFGGLTKVVSVAEEVRDPGRNLVLGMFLAFAVVLFFYVAVTFVTVGLVDGDRLAGTLTPLNLGAEVSMGPAGVIAVSVAAVLAFVSTANAGILAASRVPMAMSRDRLLPALFDKVHPERGTPTLAVLATGAFMIAVILLLDLEGLVKTASTLKLLLFLLVNVAVILMRESRIQNYRPSFVSPFYPWVQLFGIAASAVLIVAMGTMPILLACGFIIASLGWYLVYGRHGQADRTSALVHVVERVAGRDLTSNTLGAELGDILRDRDGIGEDRFDRLVASCPILDLQHARSLAKFVHQAAGELADRVGMSQDELASQLAERELETSTALTPTLAVPHVVVPGTGRFELLVARCRPGVRFSSSAPAVETVFVLLGSEDQRTFHLQALMAIAQIAQQPDFRQRWLRAADADDLRDLLLLAGRSRQAE